MRRVRLADLDVRIAGGTDREGAGEGPVVILLHGFGAPGDDLVPLWRVLAVPAGTRFVFPEAPIDLGGPYAGGRAWWWIDLDERMRRQALGERRDIAEVPEGLDTARAQVDALLDAVERELRPPPGKIVLGGFSQGAMLALDEALRSSRPFAGLVLLSGTHLAAREWEARMELRRGLPVYMSHGQSDELLPFSIAEGLRNALVAHGMLVEWVPFRGGHGIPSNVVDGVSAFLGRVLADSKSGVSST
jgi:phospholipase/carboxylesterase